MFLSSFETLRKKILDTQHIDSLLHLGPRTFDELSGEVVQNAAFVISKAANQSAESIYYRLIDGKSCAAKRDMYHANENRYTVAGQKQFEQIPGAPIAYWVSSHCWELFRQPPFECYFRAQHGLLTGRTMKWFDYGLKYILIKCFYTVNQQKNSITREKNMLHYSKAGLSGNGMAI